MPAEIGWQSGYFKIGEYKYEWWGQVWGSAGGARSDALTLPKAQKPILGFFAKGTASPPGSAELALF